MLRPPFPFYYGWLSQNFNGFLSKPLNLNLPNIFQKMEKIYPGQNPIETTRQDVDQLINIWVPQFNNPIDYTYNGNNFSNYMRDNCPILYNKYNQLQTQGDYYRIEDGNDYVAFQQCLWQWFSLLVTGTDSSDGYSTYQTILSDLLMPVTFQVKRKISRTRPSAGSYYFQKPLSYQYTVSGPHPEFTSGHSIQGIAFGETFYQKYPTMNQDLLNLLCQYSLDCGYRRLMAGIHYPSTHLGSIQLFRYVVNVPSVFWNTFYTQLKIQFPNARFE